MHKDRFARVAPKEGKWEAYFTDSPRERCLGCTAEEALARLRGLDAERRKVMVAQEEHCQKRGQKLSLGIFATVAIVGTIAAVFIMQATANVKPTHGRMYAHHRLHARHHHSHPQE